MMAPEARVFNLRPTFATLLVSGTPLVSCVAACATAIGLDKIVARLGEYAQRLSEPALAPAPLLRRLAEAGKSFAQWHEPVKAAS